MRQRYKSFGSYVKKTFGFPVQKVNIDAGFTCPNRDGTVGVGGCVYCNNESFKPGSCRPALPVREQVENGISYLGRRYGASRFLAYFQAYTNTHAPVDVLERLYGEALENPLVIGLCIGTRPDSVDDDKLDLLKKISKKHFVLLEYGLQSVYEKTLCFIRRGHGVQTFLRAVEMTRQRGLHAGAHIIVGFPTESREETLNMAHEVSDMGIEFLKIHQLQVIRGTPLAEMYESSPFQVFGYGEYMDFLSDFLERLSPEIVIQRLFATAPEEILVAPRWGRSRQEILIDIHRRLKEKDAWQGRLSRAFSKT